MNEKTPWPRAHDRLAPLAGLARPGSRRRRSRCRARRRSRSAAPGRQPSACRSPGVSISIGRGRPPAPNGAGHVGERPRSLVRDGVASGRVQERDALSHHPAAPPRPGQRRSGCACPRCAGGWWGRSRSCGCRTRAGSAVSWWTTTSGAASRIAPRCRRSRSNTSQTTASAPVVAHALRALLRARHAGHLVAGLEQSWGTRRLPIAPLAPATKTFIAVLLPSARRLEHPAQQHGADRQQHEVHGPEALGLRPRRCPRGG